MRGWARAGLIAGALGVFAWSVGAASAQTSEGPIRAGAHADFTRLVIPIGPDRTWTLSGAGQTRRVVFTPAARFDLRAVFDRIPRQRLVGIAEEDDGLSLSLGCACGLRSFRYEGRYLVIDITDTPDAASAVPDGAAGTEGSTVPSARTPPRPIRALDLPDIYDAPLLDLADLTARAEARAQAEAAAVPVPMRTDAPAPSPMPAPAPDLTEAAELLAEQLARAAAAGLLEAAEGTPLSHGDPRPEPGAPPAEGPDAQADRHSGSESGQGDGDSATPPAQPPSDGGEHDAPEPAADLPIRAATAFDIVRDRDGGADLAEALTTCDDGVGDVTTWSADIGFDQELGGLRATLHDGQGRLRHDQVVALARYYIFYGFGAEAEFWLLQLDFPPQSELAMARYLDGQPGPNFDPLESLEQCSGRNLMWRFLDAPIAFELSSRQQGQILLAFEQLPRPLRRILGPDLVRRLTGRGYQDAALSLRESLARGQVHLSGDHLLLSLDAGAPPSTALAELEAMMRTDSTGAPEAMRHYLRLLREENRVPETDMVIAAEAMLRAAPPDRRPNSLWHEVFLARIAAGDTAEMLARWSETRADPAADRLAVLTSAFHLVLPRQIDGALLLLASQARDDALATALAPHLRGQIYAALRRDGLTVLAAAFAPARPAEVDIPIPDPWASRDWPRAADASEGTRADVARRMHALAEAPAAATGPASTVVDPAELRATIADSAALRQTIEALLAPAPGSAAPADN